MSTSTETSYERTYGIRRETDVVLTFVDADGIPRRVPEEYIGGIGEIIDILNPRWADEYPHGIPRTVVSNWIARWRTTGFPRALPILQSRGMVWDLREVEAWSGPPGRWG